MIPEFNKGAEKCDLTWVDSSTDTELRMCSKDSTGLPGSRCFTSTSQSPLTQRCQFWSSKIATLVRTSIELFGSFFSRCWTRRSLEICNTSIYLQPGGDYVFRKPTMTWHHLLIIFECLKRCFDWPNPFWRGTSPSLTTHSISSGSTCCSTQRVVWDTLRADDASSTRNSSSLPSISRICLTCKWPMACLQRSVRSRSSFEPGANSVTCLWSANRRSFATTWIIVTGARIAAMNAVICIIDTTTSPSVALWWLPWLQPLHTWQ